MSNLSKNIVKAILKGLCEALSNYAFNIDNDTNLDDIENIYNTAKKINKDALVKSKSLFMDLYYEKHPRIKICDILYSNFLINEKGELLNLGDNKIGNPIGICCILPDFLPDKEVRFISINLFINLLLGTHLLPKYNKLIKENDTVMYMGSTSVNHNNISTIPLYYNNFNKFNKKWLTPDLALCELLGWNFIGSNNIKYIASYYDSDTTYLEIQWYIPTIAELAILADSVDKINAVLKSLNKEELDFHEYYFSSIAQDEKYLWTISFNTGLIFPYSLIGKVLPFLHIKLADNFR